MLGVTLSWFNAEAPDSCRVAHQDFVLGVIILANVYLGSPSSSFRSVPSVGGAGGFVLGGLACAGGGSGAVADGSVLPLPATSLSAVGAGGLSAVRAGFGASCSVSVSSLLPFSAVSPSAVGAGGLPPGPSVFGALGASAGFAVAAVWGCGAQASAVASVKVPTGPPGGPDSRVDDESYNRIVRHGLVLRGGP